MILPIAPCGSSNVWPFGLVPPPGINVLKTGSGNNNWAVGPGNYQNVDIGCGPGGDCIRTGMAGGYEGCASEGDKITTKPGNNVGPNAQGLNTIFNCPPPGCGPLNTSLLPGRPDSFPPDVITRTFPTSDPYQSYLDARKNQQYDLLPSVAQLEPPARVVAVPVINCTGTVNGSGSVDVLAVACMFLTQPAKHNGDQEIYAELLPGTGQGCIGKGSAPSSNPIIGPGPHTIILYKDFGVADS